MAGNVGSLSKAYVMFPVERPDCIGRGLEDGSHTRRRHLDDANLFWYYLALVEARLMQANTSGREKTTVAALFRSACVVSLACLDVLPDSSKYSKSLMLPNEQAYLNSEFDLGSLRSLLTVFANRCRSKP